MKRITALATCFVLLMALAAFAQTTKKSTAPKVVTAKTMLVSGTIESADATSLVITRKGATGSPEQMTFVLDAKTTKTGDMVRGATAAVHYTTDGTTNKATSVKATAPMALAAFAQATKKSTAPKVVIAKTMLVSGTIESADATSLVITRKGATGSPEQMTFVLDAKTTKTGDMVKGATAAVHYTTDGTTNKAISVKATPAKVVAPKKVAK